MADFWNNIRSFLTFEELYSSRRVCKEWNTITGIHIQFPTATTDVRYQVHGESTIEIVSMIQSIVENKNFETAYIENINAEQLEFTLFLTRDSMKVCDLKLTGNQPIVRGELQCLWEFLCVHFHEIEIEEKDQDAKNFMCAVLLASRLVEIVHGCLCFKRNEDKFLRDIHSVLLEGNTILSEKLKSMFLQDIY